GPAWDGVIARLLQNAPGDRIGSARELLRAVVRIQSGDAAPLEVDLEAPYPAGDPLAGILVGRNADAAALMAAAEPLAEGASPSVVVAVHGPPGSGRRTLLESFCRDLRIARGAGALPPFELFAGHLAGLAHLVGLGEEAAPPTSADSDPARSGQARFARLADA